MAEPYLSAPVRRKPFLRGCLTVLLVLGGFFALLLIISRMDDLPVARGERVAVIPVNGLISDSEPTIEQLKKFVKDDSVKAIVLRINSPGGGVAPSQEIYEEVKKARAKKPILASMGRWRHREAITSPARPSGCTRTRGRSPAPSASSCRS